jgi:hypothetical protein
MAHPHSGYFEAQIAAKDAAGNAAAAAFTTGPAQAVFQQRTLPKGARGAHSRLPCPARSAGSRRTPVLAGRSRKCGKTGVRNGRSYRSRQAPRSCQTIARSSVWPAIFVQRLSELGWTVGRDVIVEDRYAEGSVERTGEIAVEFARMRVDVILGA